MRCDLRCGLPRLSRGCPDIVRGEQQRRVRVYGCRVYRVYGSHERESGLHRGCLRRQLQHWVSRLWRRLRGQQQHQYCLMRQLLHRVSRAADQRHHDLQRNILYSRLSGDATPLWERVRSQQRQRDLRH